MASDSDDTISSSLEDFSEEEDIVYGLQPYLFEPQATDYQQEDQTDDSVNPDPDPEDAARLENTDWCTCAQCLMMLTVRESLCCQECPKVVDKVNLYNEMFEKNVECITTHPGFEGVCLNIWALETAYLQYRQQYGNLAGPINEKYRYIAYRQLVRWCWGWLGEKNRVVLPSCAVNKIRSRFPPTAGITGFLPPFE